MDIRSFTVAVVLATAVLGCTTNPISGREQLLLVSEGAAIADSAQAYQSLVGKLEKDGKLSHDAKLIARVERITDLLIDQAVRVRPETANWSWSVRVIDDPKTVNAWCMPGGKMAVYTGLIDKIKPTDDELAQVLGHEISHALLKHGAEKMSIQTVAGVAAVLVGVSGSDPQQRQEREMIAGLGAAAFVLLPNSRGAESEADELGLRLAARAGFDPDAAVSLWEKMIKESGNTSRFDFLSTHPAPPKRLEALKNEGRGLAADFAAAHRNAKPSRAWTSMSPNERAVAGP